MTAPVERLRAIVADLKIAILFYTRLPIPEPAAISGADFARASWAGPVAGVIVALIGALAFALARAVGLPPLPAAALTLTATVLATGGLHEDGLADTVDGFAGGTRERKLEIMRDSRIGTYGACGLMLSLLLRTCALASLADPAQVAAALIAAHAGARAGLPAFMMIMPPARSNGLSAAAGRPAVEVCVIAGLLGMAALVFGLGLLHGLVAIVLLVIAMAGMMRLCARQIGGQTGDTLGALEQTSEILVLLVAATRT
jgi:adenosylcobinamide-GDP ribazoletransferase